MMAPYPKVSIIIPTFNRAAMLPNAIDSALAQEYPNLEVVVSDNASTDNTQEVAINYTKDPRFKYFRNEVNLGLAGNWKRALYEYATGDWALILSDDDYLIDKSYIQKAMMLAKNGRDVLLVFANYQVRDEMANTYRGSKRLLDLPDVLNGTWLFWHYWRSGIGILVCTALFNREKAIALDAFSEDIIGPDIELFLKLSLIGDVGFIEDTVAVYRLHGHNMVLRFSDIEDVDTRFKNLNNIKNPARFARSMGLSRRKLWFWEKRMTMYSIRRILADILKGHRKGLLKYFTVKVMSEGLIYLLVFLDPVIFAKMLLPESSRLLKFARKLLSVMRRDSA